MKITGHTLIIATKDNDEVMGKFYSDIFGCTQNDHGGYRIGDVDVYFDRHSQAAVKALEPFRVMLTLAVDDINKAVEELKAKNVQFVREVSAEEWGGIFATFTDPDGNYIQLFQMPA
jgi:predicted enzyme related to lactoylglutathione lyase